MPLLGHERPLAPLPVHHEAEQEKSQPQPRTGPARRQSQHSVIAKTAIMSNINLPHFDGLHHPLEHGAIWQEKPSKQAFDAYLTAPEPKTAPTQSSSLGVGACLTDTPATTAPNSPKNSPRM